MEMVKKHPVAALAVAFLAGVVLAPKVRGLPGLSKLPSA